MNNLLIIDDAIESENLNIINEKTYTYFLSSTKNDKKLDLNFNLNPNSSLVINVIDIDEYNSEITINVNLKSNTDLKVNIASLLFNEKSKIYSVNVYHNKSNSTSLVSMNGINTSAGVMKFLGVSKIINGAHLSSTRQQGKITNLSPLSKSTVSPTLLIDDNDIKASHGACVGSFDQRVLFYLMSRGLTLLESKRLITTSTFLPFLKSLNNDSILTLFSDKIESLTL